MTAAISPKLVAGIDLIGRTGADNFQIRYSDDEQPAVWFAVANYADGAFQTDAAADATTAVLRLCARLVDGGECTHCHKPTMFHEDDNVGPPTDFDGLFCHYLWWPELEHFGRTCGAGDG